MSDTTGLDLIQEAQDHLKEVGRGLNAKSIEQHKSAVALMFLVREAVLEIFEEAKKTKQTRPIYRACLNEDAEYLSSAVYNLIAHKVKDGALDLMNRYQSIVSGMYTYLTSGGILQVNDLEELTENGFIEDIEMMDAAAFRSEIGNIQVDINELKQRLLGSEIVDTSGDETIDENVLRARRILATDIVYTREKLYRFFGVIHGEIDTDDQKKSIIFGEFNGEFIEDLDSLGMIVSGIIDEGAFPEARGMVNRLADFAQKMLSYLSTNDAAIFSETCVAIQSARAEEEEEGR